MQRGNVLSKDVKIKVFLDLCKIYSPSGNEREAAEYLKNFLKEYCDEVYIDDVGNVIAVRGKGPTIWLHAHMDTIPGMLNVELREGKVYGLGVADDKASLAAMACTICDLCEPPCKIVFVGVVEEETTSRGTINLIRQIENGQLERPQAVIVGEPTGIDKIVHVYRGSLKVRIVSKARGGHASTPIASSNPILKVYEMYSMICRLLDAGMEFNKVTVVPTIVQCGEASNKIPTYCEMILDIRIPPGKTCTEIVQKIENLRLVDETSMTEVELSECIDPVQVSLSNIAARALTRAIIKVLGRSPVPARKWGTSDMNLLVRITENVISYGPGQHETTHTEVECVDLEEYLKCIDVLKQAVQEFSQLASKSSWT